MAVTCVENKGVLEQQFFKEILTARSSPLVGSLPYSCLPAPALISHTAMLEVCPSACLHPLVLCFFFYDENLYFST